MKKWRAQLSKGSDRSSVNNKPLADTCLALMITKTYNIKFTLRKYLVKCNNIFSGIHKNWPFCLTTEVTRIKINKKPQADLSKIELLVVRNVNSDKDYRHWNKKMVDICVCTKVKRVFLHTMSSMIVTFTERLLWGVKVATWLRFLQ